MTNLIALLIGLGFQGSAPQNVPVLSRCDASSEVVAQVPRDTAFDVHYSIDNAPTCYLVTLSVDGKAVRGYIVDRQLDAVVAFEKSRVQAEQTAFKAPLPLPANAAPPQTEAPKQAPAAVAAKVEKKAPPRQKVDM